MGSSRLPNKVLMPILGRPILWWMLERLKLSKQVDEIVVATTINPLDDKIVHYLDAYGCRVFRGSENDVLDRYYKAAEELNLKDFDIVVRLTADCPLIDPFVLDKFITMYKNGNYDFLSNSEPLPSSWPDGSDISIINFKSLHLAKKNAIKPSEKEHVTFYFWNNSDIFKCKKINHISDLSSYRITIDYPEDFLLLEAIIENFAREDPNVLVKLQLDKIIKFLDDNPEIKNLNSKYVRGLGWKKAFELDKLISDGEMTKS